MARRLKRSAAEALWTRRLRRALEALARRAMSRRMRKRVWRDACGSAHARRSHATQAESL